LRPETLSKQVQALFLLFFVNKSLIFAPGTNLNIACHLYNNNNNNNDNIISINNNNSKTEGLQNAKTIGHLRWFTFF
jgi:hypothetical protein